MARECLTVAHFIVWEWSSEKRVGYTLRLPAASDSEFSNSPQRIMWGHASIPANQRPDTIKYVTGRQHEELTEENCAVFKKRVLIELLFLSKQNFAHHIFCNLNNCSRVY